MMAAILVAIGVYVLLRFAEDTAVGRGGTTQHSAEFLAPLDCSAD